MDEAWDRHVGIFAAGVGHFEWSTVGLFNTRDYLATNRAKRVFRVDKVEEMRCDCQRKFVSGEDYPRTFFGRERDPLFKLLEVGDPVFKLPFPIVPELGSDIGPETWGEGEEPLIGGFG
jgi:hypothetical protein